MRKTCRLIWKVCVAFCVAIVTLLIIGAMVVLVARFHESYALPNNMIIKRVFDFSFHGRYDLYASDGRTVLASSVDMMCFDDRYIEVSAEMGGGLIDGETSSHIPYSETEARSEVMLRKGPYSCNGYYKGWLGPGLLFERNKEPFVPRCDWRNLDNPDLKNREWLQKRRCVRAAP